MATPKLSLPTAARPGFEEGAAIIFRRWTALQLAVEQGWGGPDSAAKADAFIRDVIGWFYDNTEHYADDLEGQLQEIIEADFNVGLEDDSETQVAKALVKLWQGCCAGDLSELQRLRVAMHPHQSAAKASVPQADAKGGSGSESGSDEEDGSGSEDMDEDTPAASPPPRRPPPQVDDDGFQMVQRRSRR